LKLVATLRWVPPFSSQPIVNNELPARAIDQQLLFSAPLAVLLVCPWMN